MDSQNHQGDTTMFAQDASSRLFAAMYSVVISAAFLAYAIIPASPGLVASASPEPELSLFL